MNIPDLNAADLNDIRRLLQSIVRSGTVTAIDVVTNPPCVRAESGSLHTDWIPWTTSRAAGVSHWRPPFVGEDVLLLAIGGDTGNARVIGSLYTEDNPPPERSLDKTVTVYPDGARLEYDHASSTLMATLPGSAQVSAGGSVTVNAGGHIKASAPEITARAGTAISLKAPLITLDGMVTVTQGLNAATDVTAAQVSLVNHRHPGVQGGSSKTQPPE